MLTRKPIGLGLFAVVVAMLAMAFSASAASAQPTIEYEGGGAVPVGEPINGLSVGAEALTFSTGFGALECSENELNGELTANGGPTHISITSGRFEGGLQPTIEGTEACETSVPDGSGGTLHVNIVALTGLPWWVRFNLDGTTTITGHPRVDFWAVLSKFINPPGVWVPLVACHFGASQLLDTYNRFGGAPLLDTLVEQEMELEEEEPLAEGAPPCPASGKLNGTFVLTSGPEQLEAN